LRLDEHEQVLPVLAHDGLDLPTGLRLARRSDQLDWWVEVGDRVLVGGGRVCLPRATVLAVRTRRPQRVGPVVGADSRRGLGVLEALVPAGGDLPGQAADVVRAALADDHEGVLEAVTGLVGRGPGLTPSGDDALCGVMLTLRAFRCGHAHRVVAEQVRALTHRTTSLSASLLLAAADGYAVPDVVRLTSVLAAASALPECVTTDWQDPPDRPVGARSGGSCQSVVPEALAHVQAIGHSSGCDVIAGVHGTLLALAEARGACRD
ncbi:MAG: DUF2877 domain-containing protein, partial [Brachybacterium paraconglomeratum]|nr:DUF2877 domain-containing protein [Brachybacterium paraconglomeratum]